MLGADVRSPVGDVLVSTCRQHVRQLRPPRSVACRRRGRHDHSHMRRQSMVSARTVDLAPRLTFSLARRSMAYRRGLFQSSLRRRVLLARARTPPASPALRRSERILEICYTLQDRLGINARHSILRVQVVAGSAVIGWFRPIVFLPDAVRDRPLGRSASGGDRARTGAHPAPRSLS